jgi:VIT1/CCC1 family predicted Fe2+/Mn2+ transporter
MNLSTGRNRVLDPLERFSEVVFGLIMVLSFTCAISVTEIGRDDVRAMFIGAIGCNLAWGIIDAAFYLIACLTEAGRNATLLRNVQSSDVTRGRQTIAAALPEKVAAALQPADFDRIRASLKQLPSPAERPRLTGENWRGALGVFLLVFLSTFPVVIPFIFLHEARFALRISNGIAVALLFGTGHMLAAYAGLSRLRTGLAMVAIGAALVALTIALGG